MKVNKPKSPFVGGADTPDAKDIAKAVKGEKFADALSALETASSAENADMASTREVLAQIAHQTDLSNEQSVSEALRESAEVLVKSRLNEKIKENAQTEKIVDDLSSFISGDPFYKSKLLSVLQKLQRDERGGAH